MSGRLDYGYRLLATGLNFVVFGCGALVFRLLILPLLLVLPGDPLRRRQRARRANARLFRFFVAFMVLTRVMNLRIQGRERLGRPGQLIIANHPSLIDVVVLIGLVPDANCVVKQGLWQNPYLKRQIQAAGYISNNGSAEMLDEAADALREGQTLIIFPEGTRTTPGEPPRFHRGAAAIALRGARCITPVIIRVVPSTLTKATPWYRIPARRFDFQLDVGADIDPTTFAGRPLPLASRELNDQLHQLYLKETGNHD
ncbi:1-acyl-sn-glycerol-3-phosphate acyltransferase [Pseudomonas sp. SORGH_AS 211]|uniref:lysophospholipid acyltransferase family protein n=1 Tax=unclassified Pseudomonas TaxID=196821 RepID=UPI00160DDE59|nr:MULTISPECIES: lysophospholipid acyltransferase family protein [unclassified Pseudomonas]MBB2898528.1 1-acyl-sn-glycerol-3-phosphate acyltransferase [Pseudomonas sp. AS2.8]MDR6180036.1 1-acyl-sn-glycerol-3-phosphate acyltransferase [Pseudomonas sp. SORGH_AS_0211]